MRWGARVGVFGAWEGRVGVIGRWWQVGYVWGGDCAIEGIVGDRGRGWVGREGYEMLYFWV